MEISDLVASMRAAYLPQVRDYIRQGHYRSAFTEMVFIFQTIRGGIRINGFSLAEYDIRAKALIDALQKGGKEQVDAAAARFEELLSAAATQS